MLLVVFGAGASYDSSMDYDPSRDRFASVEGYLIVLGGIRPPLGDQLFELRDIFASAAEQIPKCQLILDQLRNRPSNVSVEQQLEEIRDQAHGYPEGRRQLVAVQFYLQWIISECQAKWNERIRSNTTYRALLGQIDRQMRGRPVCLVTFNYDTLLEEAFSSLDRQFESIDDYVSRDDYKIIKPHGSVNWVREISGLMDVDPSFHPLDVTSTVISAGDTLTPSDNYYLVPEQDRKRLGRVVPYYSIPNKPGVQMVLPAIAIPLEKKTGYSCPSTHVLALAECVSKTDKLLMVGWKGAENDFVSLLAKNLRQKIPKMIVSRSRESAVNIRDKLLASGVGTTGDWNCAEAGFAKGIQSREIERFMESSA